VYICSNFRFAMNHDRINPRYAVIRKRSSEWNIIITQWKTWCNNMMPVKNVKHTSGVCCAFSTRSVFVFWLKNRRVRMHTIGVHYYTYSGHLNRQIRHSPNKVPPPTETGGQYNNSRTKDVLTHIRTSILQRTNCLLVILGPGLSNVYIAATI